MRLAIVCALLLAFGAGFYLGVFSARHFSVESKTGSPPLAKMETVKLLFAGDIMLARSIGEMAAEKGDYRFHFLKTASTTQAADIAFANLESPISARGVKSGSTYSFRADPRAVEGLKYSGLDIVSVANNHIWDYGREAFLDTLSILEENGITPVGGGEDYDEAHTPRIITAGKTRIAFLAYTNLLPSSLGRASSIPAVARFDESKLDEWKISPYGEKDDRAGSTTLGLAHDVEVAKTAADIVVISFHWGDEYQTRHNAEQERVAHFAIDAGADIVVGHHPHVVQEVEEYGGGWIFYSLGNFVFDQNFSKDTSRGLLVEVTLTNGQITEVIKKGLAFIADYQSYIVDGEIEASL